MKKTTLLVGSMSVLTVVVGLEAFPPVAKPSVQSLPPVVIATIPVSGDTGVDADKTKEIRVTFSKKMRDGSWSWSQISNETYPKIHGKVHYDKDGRTCIAPVTLQPGRTYALWLNSRKYGNFRDLQGHSAVPYLLVFETKPAKR